MVEGALDGDDVRARLDGGTCIVALHACTEANAAAIEMARGLRAMWVVMPCCMRSDACLPDGCQLHRCPDDTRHALLCGSLAERYGAELIVAVDRRVTNRNLVLCGGCHGEAEGGGGAVAAKSAKYLLPPRKPKAEAPRYPDYYRCWSEPSRGDDGVAVGDATPL